MTKSSSAVAAAPNGIVAPIYFPRQVVLADDLNLDRSSHEAELARMRRLLHGWGVVIGFVPTITEDSLQVSRGYGVTPTGDEAFSTKNLVIDDITNKVLALCNDGIGCTDMNPKPDEDEAEKPDLKKRADGKTRLRVSAKAAEPIPVTAWLIARPTWVDTEARPGTPAGCEHPANGLHNTRRCSGISLELRCSLPATHTDATTPLNELMGIVCGPQGADEISFLLDMHELPGPEASFLVLGRLVVTGHDIRFTTEDRRTLLPTQTLQAWVETQTCPRLYYVNRHAQENGDHEVHVLGCPTSAREQNRIYLGTFSAGADALEAARKNVKKGVDGCKYCLPDLHTR